MTPAMTMEDCFVYEEGCDQPFFSLVYGTRRIGVGTGSDGTTLGWIMIEGWCIPYST